MSLLIKAAVTGVAGALISLLLKRNAPELALGVSIAVSLFAAMLAAELAGGLKELFETVKTQTGLSPSVVSPVLKCVGIGIITRLSSELCRDGGQGAAASAVELCGAVCALLTALPLVNTLMDMIGDIL